MNTLLIYPEYPDTFWSFKHALKFISKRAVNPPLGLITIASMLPDEWSTKLIDMNVDSLKTDDIQWADWVFVSAMNVQSQSAHAIIKQCKAFDKTIVAGGPLFTEEPEAFPEVDYLVMNEAEITLPRFLKDFLDGHPQSSYQTEEFANITKTPIPDYSLINAKKYNTLVLQYSRGCPYNCEFCDITALFGRKVRTKTTDQIIRELEEIYKMGWNGNVLFVDDNFIGNKKLLKNDLLPAIVDWSKTHDYPFSFTTEASINLSDDEELMELMIQAGFGNVFIGIETPETESLVECGKTQNTHRDLLGSVHKIQQKGLEVTGGFIVGFDNDTPSVFQKQVDFIRKSGIVTAMVGLLNAPRKTRLYERLKKEGRILNDTSGNNTDYSMNFIPRMDKSKLMEGYNHLIQQLYEGRYYYSRVFDFIKRFNPKNSGIGKFSFRELIAFVRATFRLGIADSYRRNYWHLVLWTLFNRPKMLSYAITYAVYGYHFRRVFNIDNK